MARVYSNKHRTVELKRLIQLLHQRLTSDTELLNGNASFGFTALALMALDAGDRDEALFAASEAVKRVDATCKEDILGDVTTVINRLAEQSRENPQKTQLLKHLLDQLDHIRQRKEIVSDDTR